ncbi:MAG: hypothetical protein ABSG06_02855 [Methanoregula sp.]|jgi:ABC-type polysaccharide/polyol phosphate export permease
MTSIFEYRGLIWNFIKRDISQKFVGSLLGLCWSVVNPIITLIIYILVFGIFLKKRLTGDSNIWGFALYFAAGFLPWTAFQTSFKNVVVSINNNRRCLFKSDKKIYSKSIVIQEVIFTNERFSLY